MKVLFTIDSLQQGGAEQSIANLIRYFSKDVEVSVLYFYKKDDLLPLYQTLNCDLIAMNLPGKYNWVKAIKELKKIIKNNKPDLVVSSLYRSNIISRISCKITGTPLVGTFVDDSYSVERRKTFKGVSQFKYQMTWLLDRLTSFIPKIWISNSKSIGEHNAKKLGIQESKIKVVYRGRNTGAFKEWIAPTNEIFTFISIGRLYEKKGYPELIEAFAKVSSQYNNVSLHIYGEGDYRKMIEERISQLGIQDKVKLFGNVPDAWTEMYNAHCFVFPSRFEGFSGALVEAMMTGIPIISSDIPMNLEAVTEGETALVHKLKDANDLAEKMQLMITNYSTMIAMGSRARALATEKFNIQTIARQYQDILEKAVLKN